ncbi:hypothetical protein FIU95_04900 [Microbulbifer sp. THAF38]|nr:hypothetical protein FIU95_04900 [Microbulbifer sp. THAF38]
MIYLQGTFIPLAHAHAHAHAHAERIKFRQADKLLRLRLRNLPLLKAFCEFELSLVKRKHIYV